MHRAHNFSAGPAVLPVPVLHELTEALLEYGGTGLGLMEMSHRSSAFTQIIDSARDRLRSLLAIPADYEILYLQGGASLQFHMAALNLLLPGERADFIVTGTWTRLALAEGKRIGDAVAIFDGGERAYSSTPSPDEFAVRDGARFVAYTSNNTIVGTQWEGPPAPGGGCLLVGDLSSDICSRPVDVAKHDVIYAGAQKNLGPSGVCAVILSPRALDRSRYVARHRAGGLPAMLDYALQAAEKSLYNTPNTFGIYALDRVLAWAQAGGGLAAMAAKNERKAGHLYAALDASDFWSPHAAHHCRSLMNVTWRLARPELTDVFVREAEAADLQGLKGHRSVGGLRASLYNACPEEAVHALVAFMADFERRHA